MVNNGCTKNDIILWNERLKIVNYLCNWIAKNLNSSIKKFERLDKAQQYVYGYLALGKMKYPMDNFDPLFTKRDYLDESYIKTKMEPKAYPLFKNILKKSIKIIEYKKFEKKSVPTWNDISKDMNEDTIKLLQKIQNGLCKKYNLKKEKLGKHSDINITNSMICLCLRYKCIGGFNDNLHGSVSKKWAKSLNKYTECFASPLNHKFKEYYSMFDEDIEFGSKGSFFKMIEKNGGILPDGKYEINPPFIHLMFEKIAEIIKKSINNKIKAIIVSPNWNKLKYFDDFNKILITDEYKKNSKSGLRNVSYQHDVTRFKFTLPTYFWFFSKTKISDKLLKNLELD